MASAHKKVILRTVENTLHFGYLPLTRLLEGKSIPMLDLEGRIHPIALDSVRSIAYVRDFNLQDRTDPERLTRRTFLARPRAEGLWVRLTLTEGGEMLEGLAPLDLSLLDGLLDDRGIFLIPPDIRSNTQRLYIPRHAIADMQILAVITTPSKPKTTGKPDTKQDSLFE
jgi:hypothetical protein